MTCSKHKYVQLCIIFKSKNQTELEFCRMLHYSEVLNEDFELWYKKREKKIQCNTTF